MASNFLLHLSLVLFSSVAVYGFETLPHFPPVAAPKPSVMVPPTFKPVLPPAKLPLPPPIKPVLPPPPPVYPPVIKKTVAVQGVVFCKPCRFRGFNTLVGASPLAGAVVKLVCKNTKNSLVALTKTDKNGYYFFTPQKLTNGDVRKCRVLLVSSPNPKCGVPTNLHGGYTGAILFPTPVNSPYKKTPFWLYTVRPLAFEPSKKLPCRH